MTDPELDELEQDEQAQREGRKKMAWAFGAAVVVAVLGLGLAARSCSGTRRDAARLTVQSAVARFEANPVDPQLAQAAAAELTAAGRKAEAEKLLARHEAALAGSDQGKEAALRKALAADPADDTALGQLVEIFVKRKDLAGARQAYEDALAGSPSPKRHANFGSWLYRNGQYEPAARELLAAVKGGAGDAYTRGYLGLAYYELGKKKEAQRWLDEALQMGADMDAMRTRSYELDQELGERGAAPVRRPKKK